MAPRWCLRCCTAGESRPPARTVSALRPADLVAAVGEVTSLLEPWEDAHVVLVKVLQDAVRNQGRVELVREVDFGRFVAVKRMPNRWVCSGPEEFDQRRPDSAEKPWVDIGLLRLLAAVDFPYVCRLHGVFRTEKETIVATSFCSEGDLFDWCFRETVPPPGPQREAHMLPIVAQIIDSVRWLHDLGVAHRDISLENILLSRSGPEVQVRLIDFAMATMQRRVRREVRGKGSYQAPECHSDRSVDTFLLDAFAIGVVIFAMGAQDYPWARTKVGECQLFRGAAMVGVRQFLGRRMLRSGHGELLCEVLSPDFLDLVSALLEFRPQSRACLGEAAFEQEVSRGRREIIWALPSLKGAEALLARPVGPPEAKRSSASLDALSAQRALDLRTTCSTKSSCSVSGETCSRRSDSSSWRSWS